MTEPHEQGLYQGDRDRGGGAGRPEPAVQRLQELCDAEWPTPAAGRYIYGKKRLREIDRRLRFLMKRIESAEVVDPARQKNRDRVFFGATVTYVDADGGLDDEESTLRIVGIDEASSARGKVSWVSPIARALMKAGEGDVVTLRTPNGARRIEVVKIAYEEG
jgi:transcription elongation factor GreB